MTAGRDHLEVARRTLRLESQGILDAMDGLDGGFGRAVDALLATEGKAVTTGAGKSGHVARKIAATLASTGTPSFFLHPSDACHGDLGMVAPGDAIVAVSRSGESDELGRVVSHGGRIGAPIILLTSERESRLAKAADIVVTIEAGAEACPLELAPTTSTTAALAVGDALAMALLSARDFTPEDFARTHPDGSLGRRLLTRVADLMVTGDAVPLVGPSATVAEAIVEMSAKRLGMTLVENGGEPGILTDGDLRRFLERGDDIHNTEVRDAMTPKALAIEPGRLASEALARMEERRITHLAVVEGGEMAGAIDIHALMAGRVG